MNAAEARRMTENALPSVSERFRPFVDHVEAKVVEAAGCGEWRIDRPFSGLPDGMPSPDMRDAVQEVLESSGYTWTHHPARWPGSGGYDTVSW